MVSNLFGLAGLAAIGAAEDIPGAENTVRRKFFSSLSAT